MASTQLPSAAADARVRREVYHEADVVVVGAGVFGCAMAFALANQGRSVLLLERWMKEPDRIVGELLQPGGLAALRKLGLGHCVDGIDSIPCKGYNVIYHGQPSLIPYPPVDQDGDVPCKWSGAGQEGKRPQGRSFHHGRFIMQLRRACMAHDSITVVETEVTKTVRGEHTDQILGVEARTTDRETGQKKSDYFFGHLTVIADGYDSKFRKQVFDTKPVVKSKFYALELIDCPLPREFFGQVIIGDAFPILLYQIGSRETRALIDVPQGIPEASPAAGGVRGYIRNVAIPTLPECVRPSAERAIEDGKIPRSMPNSWLPASKQASSGLVIVGDAFNMRHPLTGGGMTVAFNDALLLSELLHPSRVRQLEDAQAVRAAVDAFYWRRKSCTSIINVLAQALYTLFAANDRQLRALQLGCFEYFRRGMTDGPCALLGGILQQPSILAYHFFSVAFLAIWVNGCAVVGSGPLALLRLPLAVIDAVLILAKASRVFLPLVWREGFQ
ncbi:squalene epoxidase domain-containing protein [Hirsutella rhossiliensis]